MIIYLEGENNSGKSSLIEKIVADNDTISAKSPSLDLYLPIQQEELFEWWFCQSEPKDFCYQLLSSYKRRQEEYSHEVPFLFVDKGLITLKERILATLITRGYPRSSMLLLLDQVLEELDLHELPGLHIYLKGSHISNDSKLISEANDIYNIYEKAYASIRGKKYFNGEERIKYIDTTSSVEALVNCIIKEIVVYYTDNLICCVTGRKIWGIGGFSESGKSTLGHIIDSIDNIWNLKIVYFVDILCRRLNLTRDELFQNNEDLLNLLICTEINHFLTCHYYKNIALESIHSDRLSAMLKTIFGDQYFPIGIYCPTEKRINISAKEEDHDEQSCLREKDIAKERRGLNSYLAEPTTTRIYNHNSLFHYWCNTKAIQTMYSPNRNGMLKIEELNIPQRYKNILHDIFHYFKNNQKVLGLLLTGSCVHECVIDNISDIDILVITEDAYTEIKSFQPGYPIHIGITIISRNELERGMYDNKTLLNLWALSQGLIKPLLWSESLHFPRIDPQLVERANYLDIPNTLHALRRSLLDCKDTYTIIKILSKLQKQIIFIEDHSCHYGYQQVCTHFSQLFEIPEFDINSILTNINDNSNRNKLYSYCRLVITTITEEKARYKKDRAGVIITDAEKILLIKRTHNNNTYWVLPGGSIENGETPIQTALRECREELGLVINENELIDTITIVNQGRLETYFRVRKNDLSNKSIHWQESYNISDENQFVIDWISTDEIPSNLFPENIRPHLFT